MRKLAVFDLDGTLLDTLSDLAGAANYALRELGMPLHEREAYKLCVGNGARVLMRRALPEEYRQDRQVLQKAFELFWEYYARHAQDETKPYPGIPELLRDLRALGVMLAVLSNKPDDSVQMLLPFYFPGVFGLAFGQREGIPHKPDPGAVFEILRHFGAAPGEAIYIGDSAVDIETGKNAGLYTVGVSWGFRTKGELINAGADVIIDKPAELIKIIVDK